MAYRTCPDCGCRIFEYGCVNCNEEDYITMQGVYDEPAPRPSDKIKIINEQEDNRSVARNDATLTDDDKQQ